jgi:hypothetical protein
MKKKKAKLTDKKRRKPATRKRQEINKSTASET